MEFVAWLEKQEKIVKLLLAIFVDIIFAVARIIKEYDKKNTTAIVVWVLVYVFIPFVPWVVDIVTVIKDNKVLDYGDIVK